MATVDDSIDATTAFHATVSRRSTNPDPRSDSPRLEHALRNEPNDAI